MHESRVNAWNQSVAFTLQENSNSLFLKDHAYQEVIKAGLAVVTLLTIAN